MRFSKALISTSYGIITDSGDLIQRVYLGGSITEVTAVSELKTDYVGEVFIVADGFVALLNLSMFLYYNNNCSHACDIDCDWINGGNVYKVTPRDGSNPYEISSRTGTILGVKNGLPFEVEFK